MSEYTHLISKPVREVTRNGYKSYEIEYYCPTDEDLALVDQQKGAYASWAPGTAYIEDRDCIWHSAEGAPYLLKLVASAKSSGGNSEGSLDRDNYDNFCLRNYKSTETLIRPEWFGVKKADKIDAGYDSSKKEYIVDKALKNIDGNSCKQGDWVYKNATTADKGSYSMADSPFKEITGLSDGWVKNVINKKIKHDVFNVEYYTKDDINKSHGFSGVNNGNGFPTSRVRPKITTAGKWRVLNQETGEVIDNDGNVRTHIVRQFEYTPFANLTWDKDKNGGEWSW